MHLIVLNPGADLIDAIAELVGDRAEVRVIPSTTLRSQAESRLDDGTQQKIVDQLVGPYAGTPLGDHPGISKSLRGMVAGLRREGVEEPLANAVSEARELVAAGSSVALATKKAIANHGLAGEPAVRVVVRRAAQETKRRGDKDIEMEFLQSIRSGGEISDDSLDQLRLVTIKVDGIEVSLVDMTLDQLDARRAMYESRMKGYQAGMDVIDVIAVVIKEHGVERLSDLDDWRSAIRQTYAA